jgi:O-methyltransferase
MESVGYPREKIHYVCGRVESTIPACIPDQIALLRLDTDWYESNFHELVHLYPKLAPGAPVIIDDYGYWQGARKAVDEFLSTINDKILLHRIDNNGRAFVRP